MSGDNDEFCEDHRHTPVIREGASLRTGDELAEQFLQDASDLIYVKPTTEDLAEVAVVLDACDDDHATHGGWLGNDDLREELEALVRRFEDMLGNVGWFVEWDDGYVIWRPSADNPVAAARHLREVDG